jgi:hypothetical protein
MAIDGLLRLSNSASEMAASFASSPGKKRSIKARCGARKFIVGAAGFAGQDTGAAVIVVSASIGGILGSERKGFAWLA